MGGRKPARSRTTNGSGRNATLRRHGSLPIWLDKDMTWHAPHEPRQGRPPIFSNAATRYCLSIRVRLDLPFRQTTGRVASVLRLAGLDWPVPNGSRLSLGQRALQVQIPCRRAAEPARRQHRHQGLRRRRMTNPQARRSGPRPVAQAASGHGHRHLGHPNCRVHPQPGRRHPRPAGPAGPDPGRRRRRHRHRHRRWRLWNAALP